jgi:hypothetical protein
MGIEAHDELSTRCRLLGHAVPFSYCRQVNDGLPCRLVLDCWHEKFEVAAFVKEHYTEDQIKGFLAPPKPKMTTLVELIDKAKQSGKQADST